MDLFVGGLKLFSRGQSRPVCGFCSGRVTGTAFWTDRSHTPPPVVHTSITSSQVVIANAARRSVFRLSAGVNKTEAPTEVSAAAALVERSKRTQCVNTTV